MSTKENFRVLVVDDEPDIVEMLSYNLVREGYEVESAYDGEEAIRKAFSFKPNLILLDIMMPKKDGMQVCEELRATDEFAINKCIIVFLTARSEDYSHIAGLEAGADDYITKPIKPKVLLARIQTLLRRHKPDTEKKSPTNQLVFQNLIIDLDKRIVMKKDEIIKLPRKEFDLLVLLASKPEQVIHRDTIYSKVWGSDIIVGDRTIDVHIRKLREKIGEEHIETIKGVGYKFLG
ncbi:MAG: response regulator transcription factor [Bacteroidales bacterium]|nr:response regulator transcription factor [Bacteroidales bacterium]